MTEDVPQSDEWSRLWERKNRMIIERIEEERRAAKGEIRFDCNHHVLEPPPKPERSKSRRDPGVILRRELEIAGQVGMVLRRR